MKFSKLEALAKRKRVMTLVSTFGTNDEVTRQHLLVGHGMYPLDGMPVMNGEELLAAMDVPVDKRVGYYVNEETMNERYMRLAKDNHAQGEDAEATLMSVNLDTARGTLIPVYTPWGVRFMGAEYHAVLKGEKEVAWFARRLDAGVVMVAKVGYKAIAAVSTYKCWASEREVEDLEEIAKATRKAYDEKVKADGEQQRM